MSKAYKISRRRLLASWLSTATLAAWPSRFIAGAKIQKIQGDEMAALTPYLLFDGHCRQRSEEHTSELQSRLHLVCRLLLEKKNFPRTGFTRFRVFLRNHTQLP